MQVTLVMFGADGERRQFPVSRDMTIVGRREDCDLRIPLGDVSRKHCRLVKDDGSLRIEDLGSSNGTYRNGERVQEATLEPGDQLKIGPVWFVVQIDGSPATDDIQPPSMTPAAEATADADELEVVEDAPAEDAFEDAPAAEASATDDLEEFDPMSALSGSDSGLEMNGPGPGPSAAPGDSMQIDLEEPGDKT